MKITEEKVCDYRHTQNGADPMWCFGSTAVMRLCGEVFCTVPQAGFGVLPLSDRHIELYRRRSGGSFELVWRDRRFTREPAPLLRRDDRTLYMTANPVVRDFAEGEGEHYCESEPLLYAFDTTAGTFAPEISHIEWDRSDYRFIDHSYRGCAIDGETGSLFLTQQYITDGNGAHCFAARDAHGRWAAGGKLDFPVRACYHNLALRGGTAHVLAISDIHEPVSAWADYKLEKTGNRWDYDFRTLYYKTADNLLTGGFSDTVTVDSREDTCGLIRNHDLHTDAGGVCHIIYSARRIWHDFMRDRFFPEVRFDVSLEYRAVRSGRVVASRTLDRETEGPDGRNVSAAYCAAFHELPDGSTVILANKNGSNGSGTLSEGWHLLDLDGGDRRLPMALPPLLFHTARPRCGCAPSQTIDVFLRTDDEIRYAEIDLSD